MAKFIHFILLSGILSSGAACSQNIREFVKQSTVEVKSISPGAEDYSDLETIGKAIGESRLVMLGEQDHGDAPTFLAKSRLIKYLHEKKGFNVLAFESDFFALSYGWDQVQKIKPFTDSFIVQSVYPIWTRCKACSELFFSYIPSTYLTQQPLHLSGFDNQMSMTYSMRNLGVVLDSVIKAIGLPITKDPDYDVNIKPLLNPVSGRAHQNTSLYLKQLNKLQEIKKQLISRAPDKDFWIALVENLIQTNHQYQTTYTDRALSMNTRDQMMAKNLNWLCNAKYKDQKIIVWAANFHIAKDAGNYVKKTWNKKFVPMGSLIANDTTLNRSIYVLGFTSYEGEAGRVVGTRTKYKIPKPPGDYFESWINPDFEYAFTNFQAYSTRNTQKHPSFHLRGNGHLVKQEEEWTKIFDGVFFIRKMYSCIE
jgi:erythromycin esterase